MSFCPHPGGTPLPCAAGAFACDPPPGRDGCVAAAATGTAASFAFSPGLRAHVMSADARLTAALAALRRLSASPAAVNVSIPGALAVTGGTAPENVRCRRPRAERGAGLTTLPGHGAVTAFALSAIAALS